MPFLAPLAAALPWGKIIGGLGKAAPTIGAVVGGRAAGRQAAAKANEDQDRLRLASAAFNRQNPEARMRAAVRGDTLANVQDYQLGGEGRNLSSTGGLRPSLMSPGTRALGASASRNAVLSQLGQPGGTENPYAPMTPTPLPQAGLLDKVGGPLALTGMALPGAMSLFGRGNVAQKYQHPDVTQAYAPTSDEGVD